MPARSTAWSTPPATEPWWRDSADAGHEVPGVRAREPDVGELLLVLRPRSRARRGAPHHERGGRSRRQFRRGGLVRPRLPRPWCRPARRHPWPTLDRTSRGLATSVLVRVAL